MGRYYRIQPAGLGVDHRSEATGDDAPSYGIDAFGSVEGLVGADGITFRSSDRELLGSNYGDEVLVLECPDEETWDNQDFEGCRLDPEHVTIVARIPLAGFWPLALEAVDLSEEEGGFAGDYIDALLKEQKEAR